MSQLRCAKRHAPHRQIGILSRKQFIELLRVCAPSPQPLRSTFWSAKVSLVVRGERVVGRGYLLPFRAVGVDVASNRMLAQPRIRARDGRRHAT